MRTTTIDDISIKYADEIGYAFMPCLLIVNGSKVGSVEIEIDMTDVTWTVQAQAYKGKAVIDYRDYVQVYFDMYARFGDIDYTGSTQRSPLGANAEINITVMDSGGDRLAGFYFSTFYVWGAIRPGETWNGAKRIHCFRNYPSTFGLYAADKTTLLLDDGSEIVLPEQGMYEIAAASLPKEARRTIVYDDSGGIMRTTFSNEFDLTFRLSGDAQAEVLRIEYDDSEVGVYLRWIDRHGFYRYWLFSSGNETRAISSDTSYIRNNLDEYNDLYGYYGANGRRQSYTREDTISLCAPLVDSDTFDMLQDLASSPIVDMYLGGDKWQSVTIKAGSYTKSTAVLQDFDCSLVLNDINTQML